MCNIQTKDLLDVINLEYGHRCRAEPVEAAVYILEAKRKLLKKFRANATAELTIELEETTDDKKQEHSPLELAVDFSREDVAKVIIIFNY